MTEDQVKQLIEESISEHSASTWKEIVVAGLDSPVVLFLVFLIILYVFRSQIAALLKSRNIEFRWGDKHIKLNELSNNIDQEIDPLKDDIETLKNIVSKLQDEKGIIPEKMVSEAEQEEEVEHVKKRMYKALGSQKFRWRTIEKLAQFSRTTEEQILELISADETIEVGYDKHGNKLAKFKHR